MLQVNEFHYEPNVDLTFARRFEKWWDVFRNDLTYVAGYEKETLIMKMKGLNMCGQVKYNTFTFGFRI